MLYTKKLSLALAAFALVASAASAQQWNRRISDIRIVHPPGTPPGTWRVSADLGLDGDVAPPGPLTCDVALYLNGTLITVVTVPVTPSLIPNICPGDCSGGCEVYQGVAGSCSAVGGCHCGGYIGIDLGELGASTSSTARVVVTPSPGSLPEIFTSDDEMTVLVPENHPGTVTCTGGGLPTFCPCGNAGAIGHGCANSSNPSGAHLTASGFVEALPGGTDSVVLEVTDMPSGAPLLYFQGTGTGLIPFGDGILCTTGSLIRLRVKINVGGASRFPEPGEPSLSSAGGVSPGSGVTLYYQAYHRDSATYCTSATHNMSNGISLTWY